MLTMPRQRGLEHLSPCSVEGGAQTLTGSKRETRSDDGGNGEPHDAHRQRDQAARKRRRRAIRKQEEKQTEQRAKLEALEGSKPSRKPPWAPILHCSKARRCTSTLTVDAFGSSLAVTVTNEAAVVDNWIRTHAREGNPYDPSMLPEGVGSLSRVPHRRFRLLGMDAEWRPSFQKGTENPVALLQFSTARHCLLVQLLFLDQTPPGLIELLNSPDIFLGGVGVTHDAVKLVEHHNLRCRMEGLLEIEALAKAARRTQEEGVGFSLPRSLKDFCLQVLGVALQKRKKVTMSNWSFAKLSDGQVQYAALDAWVSFSIADRLLRKVPWPEMDLETSFAPSGAPPAPHGGHSSTRAALCTNITK